jgi:Domain of unknown function (DUF4129)
MLVAAMTAPGLRIAAAVIGLTMLICIVVVAGDGPITSGGGEPAPYVPTPEDLREAGVVTDDFPVPGALPPEVFPAEAWGIYPPGPPAWLPWVLVAIVLLWITVRLAQELRAGRIERPRWRRRTAPELEPAQPENDVALARQAIDAALLPLREPADSRAAVIEAYARMEAVLAERRLGRRAAEAPREYLERVLVARGVAETSLTSLTELFEEARFSRHPISESSSRRAASELAAVRAALP